MQRKYGDELRKEVLQTIYNNCSDEQMKYALSNKPKKQVTEALYIRCMANIGGLLTAMVPSTVGQKVQVAQNFTQVNSEKNALNENSALVQKDQPSSKRHDSTEPESISNSENQKISQLNEPHQNQRPPRISDFSMQFSR